MKDMNDYLNDYRWKRDFRDKINAADNNELLRTELLRMYLCGVEAEIKCIIGQEPSSFYSQRPGLTQLRRIDDLLDNRKYILDKMFSYSKDEIKRVEQVNKLLSRLFKQMHHRTADLSRTFMKRGMDYTFDDDYGVEGKLGTGIEYNLTEDYETVLHFENDAYYMSDFSYMLYVIQENEEELNGESVIHACKVLHDKADNPEMTDKELYSDYAGLEDGKSWSEGLRRTKPGRENLSHICFCFAFHSLFKFKHYSLVDIIHINRFYVESKLVVCERLSEQWKNNYPHLFHMLAKRNIKHGNDTKNPKMKINKKP